MRPFVPNIECHAHCWKQTSFTVSYDFFFSFQFWAQGLLTEPWAAWYFVISRQTVSLIVQGAAELQFKQRFHSSHMMTSMPCGGHNWRTITTNHLSTKTLRMPYICFWSGQWLSGPPDGWCTAPSIPAEEEPLTSQPSTLNTVLNKILMKPLHIKYRTILHYFQHVASQILYYWFSINL